jgi:hypothetical protein
MSHGYSLCLISISSFPQINTLSAVNVFMSALLV